MIAFLLVSLIYAAYIKALVSIFAKENRVIVTKVVDGDTIHLNTGEKVRFIGVDTPEVNHPKKKKEPHGKAASTFTRKLLEGRRVRVMRAPDKDKYGRTLAYVYTLDGVLINKEIIRQGLGRAYVKYKFDLKDDFLKAEAEAKNARRGIWSGKKAA